MLDALCKPSFPREGRQCDGFLEADRVCDWLCAIRCEPSLLSLPALTRLLDDCGRGLSYVFLPSMTFITVIACIL